MLSALRPEPNENTQPVPVKPFVDTGNICLHISQNINDSHELKASRPVDLVEQRLGPFRQFDA
jgi:hypothetical protein